MRRREGLDHHESLMAFYDWPALNDGKEPRLTIEELERRNAHREPGMNAARGLYRALMGLIVSAADQRHIVYMRVTKPDSGNLSRLSVAFDFAGWRDGWLGPSGVTECGLKRKFKSAVWTLRQWSKTEDWMVEGLLDAGFDITRKIKRKAKLQAYLDWGCLVHSYGRPFLREMQGDGRDAAAYIAGVVIRGGKASRAKPADWASW
jgi:hypothetical protein